LPVNLRPHATRYILVIVKNQPVEALHPPGALNENARLILDIAWPLFQQKGYRGLSLDELCERCGLTKPTLYYYFQSKENLYLQVLKRQIDGYHTAISDETLTTPQRLENLAAIMLEQMNSNWLAMLRDLEHFKNPENLTQIRAIFARDLLQPLANLMENAAQQGELRSDDPELLAWSFLGLVSTFTGRLALFDQDAQAGARWLVNFFLQGARQTH